MSVVSGNEFDGAEKTMRQPITQVDAFADRPFRGNPAAVCILSEPCADAWMRNVAREMNLSETTFAHPEGDGVHVEDDRVGLTGQAITVLRGDLLA